MKPCLWCLSIESWGFSSGGAAIIVTNFDTLHVWSLKMAWSKQEMARALWSQARVSLTPLIVLRLIQFDNTANKRNTLHRPTFIIIIIVVVIFICCCYLKCNIVAIILVTLYLVTLYFTVALLRMLHVLTIVIKS